MKATTRASFMRSSPRLGLTSPSRNPAVPVGSTWRCDSPAESIFLSSSSSMTRPTGQLSRRFESEATPTGTAPQGAQSTSSEWNSAAARARSSRGTSPKNESILRALLTKRKVLYSRTPLPSVYHDRGVPAEVWGRSSAECQKPLHRIGGTKGSRKLAPFRSDPALPGA